MEKNFCLRDCPAGCLGLTRGIRITPAEEEEYFVLLLQKLSARRLAKIGIEMRDEFASRTKRLRVVG